MITGAVIEVATSIVWIQMSGTVTSYFIGTVILLALLYRFLCNYWCGLACFLTGLGGILIAYALETAGVLPRSSLFTTDVGAAALPDIYRRTALISITISFAVNFLGSNLLARSFARGRAELARTQAALAAVVDEARLGRLSGQRLGGYQLGELLGRGGMGEVYAAESARGESAAVKVLHAHLGAESTARQRFRREAELVRRLPGAVGARIREIGEAGGVDFIAMERLHGEDLASLLRRRDRLALDEAVVLARSIAAALAHAHEAGIVHRDLKPSNVFLVGGKLDDVRLLDFGIARLYDGATGDGATLTEADAVLGSPGYMAPEQIGGDRASHGPASDVFALGAILYRAIAGQPAFPSRNPAAAMHEALHRLPPPPSRFVGVTTGSMRPAGDWGGVDRAIGVALAKEPLHRFRDPRELAEALARAAAGDPLDELADRATGITPDDPSQRTLTATEVRSG
jgi:serine/threonine-protein kinase